ncbi:two-component sensor histidine kinase [Streptomyces sp. Tu 2975]|uniref:sensor histidine kinase n=1 Tax=Streptomyces sp. Tu 2975 TaxID=2676871 RepID=UPI001357CE48|nr:histidine kinase [Streptomyces sp. Tu 2975]QIP86392.1 two-component sensor histidine kinase [Streptomyces sp. Tu 2975]
MSARYWAGQALVVVAAVAEALATRVWLEDWMAVGALAAAGLLVLRGRFPRTVFVLMLPTLATGVLWLPAMCALYALAASQRRRGEVVAASAAVAVVAFVPWRDLDGYAWSLPETTLGVLLAGLLAVAPAALGLLGRARAELAARLAELALSRERERRYAAEQAALRERERLARDVHDTAAHHLSLISLRCSGLAATADSAPYRDEAAALGELSRRAAADLRRAIRHDGPGLAQLPELLEAARDLVEAVHLDAGDCPPAVEHAAYRIVQEGLTNIRRHAPGAAARVTVRRSGHSLLVAVHNDPPPGPCPPPDPGGHGLSGLRTRTAALGGTLTAGPTPAGGFVLAATLPVPTAPGPGAELPVHGEP